jgi:hypothetical protein
MSKKALNSLDRFRKHPGQLVLEEHGHCEVPAGCGGVVLRWRNPNPSPPRGEGRKNRTRPGSERSATGRSTTSEAGSAIRATGPTSNGSIQMRAYG